PIRTLSIGRVILDRAGVHIADVREDAAFDQRYAELVQLRSVLAVPIKRDDSVIGGISVSRSTPGPFSDNQIALLKTFADQAVIAIENVRLFNELQEKNQALTHAHAQVTEALEQQTATSEILKVISRSPTDVQPVFDGIVASAVRLLRGYSSVLTLIKGDLMDLAALTSTAAAADAIVRASWPRSLHSDGPHAWVIRDRAPVNYADASTDPRLPESEHAIARARGYRSLAFVPMLRHDEAVGMITLTRLEPGALTPCQIPPPP